MAKTRSRDLATGLGRAIQNDTITADGAFTISGGRTVQTYDLDSSGGLLTQSTASKVSGDMAYLKNQNEMYVWNDSDGSWYELKVDDDPLDTLDYWPSESLNGEFINNSPPRDGAGAGSTWDNSSAVSSVSGYTFRVFSTDPSTTSWVGAATAEPLPTGKRYFEIVYGGYITTANTKGIGVFSWKGNVPDTDANEYFQLGNAYVYRPSETTENTGLGEVTTNDVIMWAYDTTLSNNYGKWWVGKNGNWNDQGTPDGGLFSGWDVRGTNTSFYNAPLIFGVFGINANTGTDIFTFRDRHTIQYAPPTGFTAI